MATYKVIYDLDYSFLFIAYATFLSALQISLSLMFRE